MRFEKTLPCLGRNGDSAALYVDGEPFFILGGELHNSSASSLEYMEAKIWPAVRELGLNTILLPISWETVEPEEGKYDFSLLRGLLEQAEREGMRLVLLWFGLWKNGESFYVPGWMKEDTGRYFRAEYRHGGLSDTISPFCVEAVEKDRQAFMRLMEYLREQDTRRTVIMIQVENEIGLLKTDRDYSPAAGKQFKERIPETVREIYGADGTWEEAFHEDAPEYFMAYYYARAVERIASAGKEIYPLPMYVNAWLEQHPDIPGVYPSGGPVAKLIPLWRRAAPSVDMFAPDIYLPQFAEVCEEYRANGNPLFIPEAVRSAAAAANVFYAAGGAGALGFSPFGIEDLLGGGAEQMSREQLKELNIDGAGLYAGETAPLLKAAYRLLDSVMPEVAARRGTDRMCAFIRRNPYEKGCILHGDGFDVQLDYTDRGGTPCESAGIVLWQKGGFHIMGCNVSFQVRPKKGSGAHIGLLRYEEGNFEKGKWIRGRILNGDELYRMELGAVPEARFVQVRQAAV